MRLTLLCGFSDYMVLSFGFVASGLDGVLVIACWFGGFSDLSFDVVVCLSVLRLGLWFCILYVLWLGGFWFGIVFVRLRVCCLGVRGLFCDVGCLTVCFAMCLRRGLLIWLFSC